MPQQTLHTEGITLVPLADELFEWEIELDSDPEVMRYVSWEQWQRQERQRRPVTDPLNLSPVRRRSHTGVG